MSFNPFPPRPSTREDAAFADYLSAELAHQEQVEHFNSAERCDACDRRLLEDRFEDDDGFVVCAVCAHKAVVAFGPEIAAAAGETRWGAQS